ncbi:unnamed protein product [Lymnaea stagnalis]|uniref:Fe2OG dioxygenase domain-containing protein n=1 Tax=Lymnaea stagnalis TaxID=6523 RepID=A0AAV2HTP8_LYMST
MGQSHGGMLLNKDKGDIKFLNADRNIVKEEIVLPEGEKGKLAFVLHNVISREECQSIIDDTEKRGYDVALLNVGQDKQALVTEVRNSKRCIIDSVEYADELWSKIKEFVPEVFKGRKILGLNERLRFLRYEPGDYFRCHLDGSFVRDNGETSLITLMLYLNEDFEGGATTFIGRDDSKVPLIPKTGSVLLFEHFIYHEGSEVIKGRKYAMRTDIMASKSTGQVR